MKRFLFSRFTLPALVLWTACLYGQQNEQLSIVWETGPIPQIEQWVSGISAAADGVYVTGEVFVIKYDLNGNQLWVSQFAQQVQAGPYATAVAAAADGVYVVGYTYVALPGQTYSGSISGDTFLIKFDLNGSQLWSRELAPGRYGYGYGFVSATADGVYLSSYSCVRKYDLSGNEVWAKELGTNNAAFGTNNAARVSAAPDGFYLAGSVVPVIGGHWDAYVTKYDLNGNAQWTRQFGTAGDDGAVSVLAATDGVYVGGGTNGVWPGATKAGGGFLVKFDPNGNEIWTHRVNPGGGVIINGLQGISPAPGGIIAICSASGDLFQYDSNGNAINVSYPGSLQYRYLAGGVMDASTGPVYVAGSSGLAKLTFGPGITRPISRVSSLPTAEYSASFSVQWSGTDTGGPGIQNYTIYVSENGGPFSAWLTQTTSTQATFSGVSGHTYGFYSTAQDTAGTVESSKSAAEATTYVDATKPISHVSSLPASEPTPSFTVQWPGTDTGGPGIQNYTIYVSDNGAPFAAWLTQTTATQATFNGANGHTYGFYSVAQDTYGVQEGAKSTAEASTMVVPKPSSHVSSLPATETSQSFLVQWSGTDAGGPGIANYSIYVSDNGSPFSTWLSQTSATQATYTGANGHTYGFYSIARDTYGNSEKTKSAAEASTFVQATVPKPTSHVSSLPATEPLPSFVVQWSGTDAGGPGIANYSIYVSDNGGNFTAWLTQTTATQATFTGTNGHTYGFYSIAQDSNGVAENSKSALEAVTTVVPKPLSHAASPATPLSPNFQVQWSGTDTGGPGIGKYNVYMSDTGGPFTLWQSNTAATQAWYAGYLGHTYAFFSQATDTYGNQESLKSVADATTQTPASSPKDVNHDGQINCTDISIVNAAMGSKAGASNWNAAADINGDGVIDVRDLAAVSQMLTPGTKCN